MTGKFVMDKDRHKKFAELLRSHRKILFKVSNSYAWNPEDRAELMQEITLQLWRAFPSFDPSRQFSTWMYRVAMNVAISYVRQQSEKQARTVDLQLSLHDVADPTCMEPELAQQISILHRVIASLGPLNKALMLLYLEEHSTREIAEILGLSETNVSTKLSRLKQLIRVELT
jgi:RNA polymerase sigma-70 factor (ECF subfamily)